MDYLPHNLSIQSTSIACCLQCVKYDIWWHSLWCWNNMKVKECKANRKYWSELKRFNLFSVSQIWIIYEGNFTLMLTPLAVIRKLGLRHFYFITRNSLEIEMCKETECLRNYFITESIKADENEKSRQTMFSLCHSCCYEEFFKIQTAPIKTASIY